jgi:signal transduction histidine kinase
VYWLCIITILTMYAGASAQQVRFRRVGLEQGLPQSYVNQIEQDVQGYLWLGTQDGLARFDGRMMRVYRNVPGNPASIVGNNVHELVIGRDSLVYATTGDGRCRFDPLRNAWTRVPASRVITPLRTNACVQVHSAHVNVRYTDKRGRVWTATVRDGLIVKDPQSQMTYVYGPTQKGDRFLPVHDVWALHEDSRGRMWVGMNGGGLAILENMKVVARFRHDPAGPTSISSDLVRTLFEDNIGTMWIGTHGGGLCQYDPYAHILPLLKPTQLGLGLRDDFVRGITTDASGTVYVGLRTGVIKCDTTLGNAAMVTSWSSSYTTKGAARALFVDALGTLWIGTERGGLAKMRKGSAAVSWVSGTDWTREFRKTISCITAYDDEHILVGTDEGFAVVDIRSNKATWMTGPTSPMQNDKRASINALVRLNDSTVLVGTEYGLYTSLRGKLGPKMLCPDTGVVRPNIDIIRSIDLHGNIAYVATWGGGVRCIDLATRRETVIDSRMGLPNNTVYAVYCIGGGRDAKLVASTNAGIVVWSLRTTNLERVLTPVHGAQSYEYNSWSHARLSDASMLFGGVGGLNILRSGSLSAPPPPRVIIERDTSAGAEVRVTFSAIALSGSEPLTYRYSFDASDTLWTETSSRELVLSTMAPGTHVLRVQARYGRGSYGEAASIVLTIPTPVWMSWWFYGAIALTGGLVTWRTSARVARKKAEQKLEAERIVNEERIRIARDLHDDVGTGLAKIVIMAENAVASNDAEAVRTIADTAQEVIDSVRSIVWVMKSSDDRLASAIGYVRDKIQDLLADKGIEFLYEESLTQDHTADAIMMRSIVLSVKEIATNIVRHSQASSVEMHVRDSDNQLTIDIRDSGIGFDQTKHRQGHGLSHLRERMAEIGGRVDITSSPTAGTRVILSMPLNHNSEQ